MILTTIMIYVYTATAVFLPSSFFFNGLLHLFGPDVLRSFGFSRCDPNPFDNVLLPSTNPVVSTDESWELKSKIFKMMVWNLLENYWEVF